MQYYFEPEITLYKNGKAIDLSEFGFSINVSKSVKRPVASFNIVFNPAVTLNGKVTVGTHKKINELLTLLQPNDIIAGKLDKRSKRHSFLGMINNPYESISKVNNQTSRSLVVHGSYLLPKILMKDTIAYAPVIANLLEVQQDATLRERAQFFTWVRGLSQTQKTSPFADKPQVAVEWILDNMVATNTHVLDGKNAKSLFPGTKSGIKDFEGNNLINMKFLDHEFLYGKALTSYGGPILNYIYECLDRQFYELFFDTTTGENGLPYNTLTIRTNPFSHKDIGSSDYFRNWMFWEDLQTKEIKDSDILKLDIGKNDYELKNFFRIYYDNYLMAQEVLKFGVNYPSMNFNSIKKYGLREMSIVSTVNFNPEPVIEEHNKQVDEGSVQPPDDIAKQESDLFKNAFEKRDKVKEWFGYPYYESGQIRTKLLEEVTIGQRANLPEYKFYNPHNNKIYKGTKFYIQDVRHHGQWGRFAESVFGVSNGHPDGVVKEWFNDPENKFTDVLPKTEGQKTKIEIDTPEIWNNRQQIHNDIIGLVELN